MHGTCKQNDFSYSSSVRQSFACAYCTRSYRDEDENSIDCAALVAGFKPESIPKCHELPSHKHLILVLNQVFNPGVISGPESVPGWFQVLNVYLVLFQILNVFLTLLLSSFILVTPEEKDKNNLHKALKWIKNWILALLGKKDPDHTSRTKPATRANTLLLTSLFP